MTTDFPHDDYMTAVASALAACGIAPSHWWNGTDDSGRDEDVLDAVFEWVDGVAAPAHWPHGVHLIWDQHDGWRLVESGGARTIYPLSQDSGLCSDPRQVAADTHARLSHGPDSRPPARSASRATAGTGPRQRRLSPRRPLHPRLTPRT